MPYQIKAASKGKVKLSNGNRTVVLDDHTSQEVLAEFYQCDMGRQHITEVAAATPLPAANPPK